jgi:hypothetical protein
MDDSTSGCVDYVDCVDCVDCVNCVDCVDCAICLEPVNTYIVTHKCNCKPRVHESCFQLWINLYDSCIICKSPLRTFNKNSTPLLKIFDLEFQNSRLLTYLQLGIMCVTKLSKGINSPSVRFLLFNVGFGCAVLLFLICIIFLVGISVQTKYFLNYCKGKTINNNPYPNPYTVFFIKN